MSLPFCPRIREVGLARMERRAAHRRPKKARKHQDQTSLPETVGETTGLLVEVAAEPESEHIVLVTNLDWEPRALAHAYRQRADCEPSLAR
jgi:hypothetical protein